MRRLIVPIVTVAALATALPAAADLRPVTRTLGDVELPRVRPGTVTIPPGHARGRITVLVGLAQPPLARYGSRTLAAGGSAQRLNVSSAASRAYLARLDAAQAAAERTLRRAIPEARVQRRYRIVLNGLAVELPARELPALVRQGFATRIYPSVRYRLALNASPAIIGADALRAAGLGDARGEGVKIGVVDDGVDPANRFFNPAGFSYPPGFPRGGTRWTTPKVIVARSFPGPGSGREGRLALAPRSSFHGTHVAGIAAGNEGTNAPAGEDHPATPGLSGVAPRAWIGNYRVFNVPTPIGHVANSPEIVAAFEAAVADGMDVINFSGGGPESEPDNDVLVDAVANVVAAGVVPVISAGNDRDEFGFGTAGSPGTAPEAIAVAAVSNSQVFAPAIRIVAPELVPARPMPFRPSPGTEIPGRWPGEGVQLTDVGSLGDPYLCGPQGDPNGGGPTLPPRSLAGRVALVLRGRCTFVSKVGRARAAGAVGIVFVDNRPGEASGVPLRLTFPSGMVSDLDGAELRAHLAGTGGTDTVQIGTAVERIETGRSGIVTSFSSAGPTAFFHRLKPDVAAPGGQILSATLPAAGGPFAVFDGTSMAAPHVAGAAAILVQRHGGWTPRQVKSALTSTAGAAFADTARSAEAPVTLQGGGLVDLPRADRPLLFTEPTSLSFGDLDVSAGGAARPQLVRVTDANGGGGTWQVELQPQSATAGATIDLPSAVDVAPGGEALLVMTARGAADAAAGENYGFVVLRRGPDVRRIPYFFLVERPALAAVPAVPLRALQSGTTASGASRVDTYRYPSWPFGPPPDYTGAAMRQDGAEKLYVTTIDRPVANFGVAVLAQTGNAQIDPWVLRKKNENDVQGAAGTPVNVNPLTFGYRLDIGAAGAALPKPGRYYVSVDSGRDIFTNRRLAGRYILNSWVDDVSPPFVLPITTRVSSGRPTIAVRVIDGLTRPEAGVDPTSLVIAYRGVLVGAAFYDPFSGIALFPLPRTAPALRAGRTRTIVVASDYQEAKNVNTFGPDVMPNTTFAVGTLRVVTGPAVTWLVPERGECVSGRTQLTVLAASSAAVRAVQFFADGRRIATDRRAVGGLYDAAWQTARTARGRHVLRAVVSDARGRTAAASRAVRVCRR